MAFLLQRMLPVRFKDPQMNQAPFRLHPACTSLCSIPRLVQNAAIIRAKRAEIQEPLLTPFPCPQNVWQRRRGMLPCRTKWMTIHSLLKSIVFWVS